MKLAISICVLLASTTLSNAAALLGPQPTAAPRLQKRVFPTGSAAVASFLATIDPAELSTYFSWAANGNNGFISHAQSFTSANAAQYSSYLAAKNIDSSEASAILGGIQTKSTEAAAGGAAGGGTTASSDSASPLSATATSEAGASSTSGSSAGSGSSSSTPSDLTTLPNGDVVQTLSNGDAIQGISLSENGALIPVSTTGAGGSLVPASTTYLSGGTFLTPTPTSTSASVTGGSSSAISSAAASPAGAATNDSYKVHSINYATFISTLLATTLVSACLFL